MKSKNSVFLFVRTGGVDMARYGITGTVECKLIEPLGIEYCVSFLRSRGVESNIYDLSINPGMSRAIAEIEKINPICLGFSVLYSHMFGDVYEMITQLRRAGYRGHITLGGTYPTLSADIILGKHPLLDSICRVEGELVSYNLYQTLASDGDLKTVNGLTFRDDNDRIVSNTPQCLVDDLDHLPNPARDNFQKYLDCGGILQIHSSRGCHANCSFCGTAAFYRKAIGRKWRARSPSHIVDELQGLMGMTTEKEVWFTDDNFIGPGGMGNERAMAIADEIIKRSLLPKFVIQSRADNIDRAVIRKLKAAGLQKVYIGVESGSETDLVLYGKRTRVKENLSSLKLLEEESVFVELGFIGFNPFSTISSFEQDVNFLEKIALGSRFIHPFAFDSLIPYRGTPIADKLIEQGLTKEGPLDLQAIVPDENIRQASECVDFLLIKLGPATEFVKALIINDSTFGLAQEVIREKNSVFIEGLRIVLSSAKTGHIRQTELKRQIERSVAELNLRIKLDK